MNARLAVENDPRAADGRDLVHVPGVESQIRRERGLVPQRIGIHRGGSIRERPVQVGRDPRVVARDAFLANDGVDLSERGEPGIPRGLRVVAAEPIDQRAQPLVGHHREVRARIGCVVLDDTVALEHDDRLPRLCEQVRGR